MKIQPNQDQGVTMDLLKEERNLAADAQRQAARCRIAGAYRDLNDARLKFQKAPSIVGLRALRMAHLNCMAVEHAMVGEEFQIRAMIEQVPEPEHPTP